MITKKGGKGSGKTGTPQSQKNGIELNPETKQVGAFAKIDREISLRELKKNPVVIKFLLEERGRLLSEKAILEKFRDSYYEVERQKAVCNAMLEREVKSSLLHSTTMTVGGILFGAAISKPDEPFFWPMLISGALLVIVGIVISLWKK